MAQLLSEFVEFPNKERIEKISKIRGLEWNNKLQKYKFGKFYPEYIDIIGMAELGLNLLDHKGFIQTPSKVLKYISHLALYGYEYTLKYSFKHIKIHKKYIPTIILRSITMAWYTKNYNIVEFLIRHKYYMVSKKFKFISQINDQTNFMKLDLKLVPKILLNLRNSPNTIGCLHSKIKKICLNYYIVNLGGKYWLVQHK